MESLFNTVAANPWYYLGVCFAILGGFAFLIFLRGFISGVGNLFHMHGHDEHLQHARVRVVWGLYLMMATLGLWELIRIIAGQAPGSTIVLVIILLLPAWWPALTKFLSGLGGGGGH